MLLNLLKET
ncbi:hypothetical protein OIU78_026320, partial [Salix suchowensis]